MHSFNDQVVLVTGSTGERKEIADGITCGIVAPVPLHGSPRSKRSMWQSMGRELEAAFVTGGVIELAGSSL